MVVNPLRAVPTAPVDAAADTLVVVKELFVDLTGYVLTARRNLLVMFQPLLAGQS
jgi:hypothetical protein